MTVSTLSTFTADLTRWQHQVAQRSDALLRDTALALFDEVQLGGEFSPGTPIVTGHARASWQITSGDLPSGDAAESPEAARAGAATAADAAPVGQRLYVGNTADYIRKLEFGSSDQAPQGMMRLAASAGSQIAEDATEKIAHGSA